MRRPLMHLVTLLLLFFAGCTFLGGPPTAKQADGIAAASARAWQDDAAAVLLDGVETRFFHRGGGDITVTDEAVGDGHASLWYVQYSSDRVATVDKAFLVANGTVVRNETQVTRIESRAGVPGGPSASSTVEFRFHPIVQWNVDSDRVVGIARDHNETWRRIAAAPTYLGFTLFGGNGTNPVWVAGISNVPRTTLGRTAEDASGEAVVVYIDATTGEYLPRPPAWLNDLVRVETRASAGPGGPCAGNGCPEPPRGVPEESGALRGTLTLAEPETATFDLELAGHPMLSLTLRANGAPQSIGTVRATLTDTEGRSVTGTAANPGGSAQPLVAMDAPAAGRYTLRLELSGGVLVPYEVAWLAAAGEA